MKHIVIICIPPSDSSAAKLPATQPPDDRIDKLRQEDGLHRISEEDSFRLAAGDGLPGDVPVLEREPELAETSGICDAVRWDLPSGWRWWR